MVPEELRALVRSTVGLPQSYPRLDDPTLDGFLDEAFTLMAAEIVPARLSDSVDVAITGGVDLYAVTGSPAQIVAINLNGAFLAPVTLGRLELEAPRWRTDAGTPTKYWLQGVDATGSPKIRLYPKPIVDGTLKVSVIKKPPVIAAYDGLEIVDWSMLAQYAAAFYAAWRHGTRSNEVVDPAKQQGFLDTYTRYVGILSSEEDPTFSLSQQRNQQSQGRTSPQ